MGTMRDNFATAFVILVLMLSTSQSLPHGYENSSRRNSFTNDLIPAARAASYPIYNCLFIDPDLPICDVDRMLSSEEKTTESTSDQYFDRDSDKDFVTRSRRNADVSATARVVVYTIEGCVPSRIPFSLPSCNGIALDNIVDVQRLRPFAVKGVTDSPYVFPKFNYSRWIRMMARLHSHISSKKPADEEIGVPKEISAENSLEDRKEESRIMPKGSMSNRRTRKSKANKSRKFSTSSSIETVDNDSKIISRNTNDESSDTELSSKNSPSKKSSKKIEKQREMTNKRTEDHWKRSKGENEPAIPAVPAAAKQAGVLISKEGNFYEQTAINDPSNHPGINRNSRNILQLHDKEKKNEIVNDSSDFVSSEARSFRRRRREIRLTGNGLIQEIADESKAQGISGKSTARRFQSSEKANRLNISNEQRKYSKNMETEERRIVSTTAIPGVDTENHGKRSKFDNPSFKIAMASRKESWRRSMTKDAALGKKHKNYAELPASGSQ